MIDWFQLQDAYGSAEAVPGLLAAAESGDSEVWNDLWSRLCHQGTVYSASSFAIPALAALAENAPQGGYSEALQLASAIVSSTDRSAGFEDPRIAHTADVRALRDKAERNLQLADGFPDFAYALQALMAFEDVPIWQMSLEWIANEEAPLACPECATDLLIGLGAPDFATRQFTGEPNPSGTPRAVTPAESESLVGGEARIVSLATTHSQHEFTKRVLYLFGETSCPACERTFSIPQALADG